jgi:hypothetical protein
MKNLFHFDAKTTSTFVTLTKLTRGARLSDNLHIAEKRLQTRPFPKPPPLPKHNPLKS